MSTRLRIYCAGGFGVNIGQLVSSDYAPCYIDTSQSNRTEGLDLNLCYFIEGVDGSGQDRKLNYPVMAPLIPDILERFPPGDFNDVVFAASGGSGSVAGPLRLRQLLLQGETAIAVVAGADDSARHNRNTLETLKSLETISANVDEPLVMSYHQNTAGIPRSKVDDYALYVLEALANLASQDNRELDTQDLANWAHYNRVSGVAPQLAVLHVHDSRGDAMTVIEPIATASLYMDSDMDNPFGNPHYATSGYPRNGLTIDTQQLHFVINIADVEEITQRIDTRQQELARTYSNHRQRKAIVDQDDNITSDGLIL